MSDYGSFDHSLGALEPFGPNLKNGLSNHVPMAAEALCALGQSTASAQFVAAQLDTIAGQPKALFGLDPAHWQKGLNRYELHTDWRHYFETEIDALGWQQALNKWAKRLAPGLFASATHGIIRTGHAARALDNAETPPRRHELATGLAVWASTYHPLPTDRTDARSFSTVSEAFDRLPRVPKNKRNNDGLITDALAPLDDMPEFATVIGWLDLDQNPEDISDQLAARQAQVFLDHVKTPLLAIVFTHAITSVHAILNIAPHVSAETKKELLAYGWQSGAALYAAYADENPNSEEPSSESEDVIIAEAVTNGDDHVVKLSEACVSFSRRTNNPIFRQVPAHARTYLPMS